MKLFKIFSSAAVVVLMGSCSTGVNAKDIFTLPNNVYQDVCSGIKYNYSKPVAVKVIGKRKINRKRKSYIGKFKVTYYWPGEDRWGHKTKTGVRSQHLRTIAVDPDVIPLNSKVIIKFPDSTRTMIAVDTGKAVKGKVIDVFTEYPIKKRFYAKVYLKEKG